MTFADLADYCSAEFYKPAELRDGLKISGVRSHASAQAAIYNLKSYFGKRMLNAVTPESLVRYKEHRTMQSIRSAKYEEAKKRMVSITTVNRELSIMRKMMRYALQEGWVLRDIFYNAKVIDATREVARQTMLSFSDEERLLASCQGDRVTTYTRNRRGKQEEISANITSYNPRLRAMIILALDSGMRRGEIFKLSWKDINLDENYIRVIGTHTKTETARLAPLSDRAKKELENIRHISVGERPFPLTDIKNSFATARKLAGIKDLHFRDLRRTFVTRQLVNGASPMVVAKLAGHAQIQTTMKHYTSVGVEEIRQINEQINARNQERSPDVQSIDSLLIN